MQTDVTGHNTLVCCWGVLGPQCCVRLHGPKSLTGFKLYATSANIGLLWSYADGRNVLGPTMLRGVGQQCCVRLHGP